MSGSPSRVQLHFRYRTDTGTIDATPTWGANEDTNYSPSPGTNFRLRFLIQNSGTATTGNEAWSLRYSYDGGAYTAVTTTSSVVKSVDAGSSADNTAIATARLTAPGSGSYIQGQYDETGATGNIAITTGNYTEVEYGIQIVNADVAQGKTIDFRVYAAGAPLQTYTVTPRSTVQKIASGTLATTESSNDTASVAGDVIVQGTLNATDSIDTAALSGDVIVQGTLSVTEGTSDTAAFAGDVIVQGTLACTEGSDAVSLAGDVIVQGSLAPTDSLDIAAFTGNVSGSVDITGTLATTEMQDVATLAGDVIVRGAFSSTEPPDIASLSASILIQVLLNSSDPIDVGNFVGDVIVKGTLTSTETKDVAHFSGLPPISYVGAATLLIAV